VRINLADDAGNRRRRKKGRRRRGAPRRRSYDASVAMPQALPRDRSGLGRSGSKRGRRSAKGSADERKPAGRSQATPSRTARSRVLRRRRSTQPEAAVSVRASRGSRWRLVMLRLPVVVALVALAWLAIYTSTNARFFVYDAQIVGGRHLGPEAIYQAAGVHEQNIFWVDPQRAAEDVMQLEGVKSVSVRCELPARVTIEVEEREPVVMWRATTQQQDLWLDEEGRVLPYHGDVNSPEMVFVVDYGERDLQVGDEVEPEGIVQSSLQLDAALPGVKVFFYQPDRGLSFTHRVNGGEWPVYVGTSEDLTLKIQVLQVLTEHLLAQGTNPRYVDVRWAEHPVYGRPFGETAAGEE
jgi:cell division protein FtsQ